jgi:post-segregation antitoxin (ccd killing protein)
MTRPASRALPPASLGRATNVTISEAPPREANLATEVAERRRRWLKENQEAMKAWNECVESHGLSQAAFQ